MRFGVGIHLCVDLSGVFLVYAEGERERVSGECRDFGAVYGGRGVCAGGEERSGGGCVPRPSRGVRGFVPVGFWRLDRAVCRWVCDAVMRKGARMERLRRQMEFVLELDRQKEIERQTYLADGSRKEGDAEHAWHMAVMAFLLAEYANEEIDVLKAVKMALLHDVVEIDAGDTYAYDRDGNQTKGERERKAADRIYGMLPPGQREECLALWEEFEAMETPEAKFVNTLDKVQPLLLNHASGGKSWKEHHVRPSWVFERNARTNEGSEALWDYARGLIEESIENGNLS